MNLSTAIRVLEKRKRVIVNKIEDDPRLAEIYGWPPDPDRKRTSELRRELEALDVVIERARSGRRAR